MKRVLVLLSSSFPFGPDDTAVAAECPTLEAAFDEVVVISNDLSSAQVWPTGPTVSCERIPYELSFAEKILALRGLLLPVVWRDLVEIRRRHPGLATMRVLSTLLISWSKAKKFARRIARVASRRPGMEVHGYSFWANDMAIAVALARKIGVLRRATSRAHGWDVYTSRPEVGFLPFRRFLADNLDSLLFVSADGRNFFESSVGRGRAALEVVSLGTPRESDGPVGRADLFTIVSCSWLVPLKRMDLLAKAVMGFGRPIRWIHVGDGPERSKVQAICANPPPGVEVVLMGFLPQQQVVETWRKLRPSALVNVSVTEGLPVSMMEAMSLGIPVIGTRVGGVPEIVADGVNGYLLSAAPTPDEVATTISAVSELSAVAFESMSKAAWQTWHDRFQADTNLKLLVDHLLGPSVGENGGSAR